MLNWLRDLLGEKKECQSCRMLLSQLDFAQTQNKYLLGKLLEPQIEYKVRESNENPQPIGKAPVPWGLKRSILEAEDRKQAQLLRDRTKEIKDAKSVDELEKSLDIETNDDELKEEANG